VSARQARDLKEEILNSGLTVSELVRTAWASASTYRASDRRGGANGARIALEPQRSWEVNDPAELKKVLKTLQSIQEEFNSATLRRAQVSLADMIVLGGAAAIEKAARDGGVEIEVPFIPGRGDATQEQTDVSSFELLKPTSDAFRNYHNQAMSYRSPLEMLVDKADQLQLTVPEMVVLIGGMRALGANAGGTPHGVFTKRSGVLTNDFFLNLLDNSLEWRKSKSEGLYEGVMRGTREVQFTATPVDLVFGSNSELRAVAEVYAYADSNEKFVRDFVQAWAKVMQLDR